MQKNATNELKMFLPLTAAHWENAASFNGGVMRGRRRCLGPPLCSLSGHRPRLTHPLAHGAHREVLSRVANSPLRAKNMDPLRENIFLHSYFFFLFYAGFDVTN